MASVNCIVCGVSFKRFRFSSKNTCSKRCYNIARDAATKKTVKCANCGKDFQVGLNCRRVTCGDDCHRDLAIRNASEVAVRRELELAEAQQRKQQLRVGSQFARDVEPRRKCPCCGQRVRLFRSVSGAIWLRAHKINGEVCEGSRSVVSYPNERKGDECYA